MSRTNQEPHALIVGRVEPEHPIEDTFGVLESTETPAAQPEPVHAAEERPVVEVAPRQQTVEVAAERQLADAKSPS